MKNSSHGTSIAKKYEYRLHYLHNSNKSNPKFYFSDTPKMVGDVIQVDNGFYHYICNITQQKTGVRLDLGEAETSVEEARNSGEQG